jgi:hypothetical protein
MLQDRIRAHQRRADLEQIIVDMPAYPIYRDAPNLYSIYVDGEIQIFTSESAARLGQFVARLRWLRSYGCEEPIASHIAAQQHNPNHTIHSLLYKEVRSDSHI